MPIEVTVTLCIWLVGVAGCVWAYWTAEDDPAELIDMGLSGPNKKRAKELNDEFARAMGGAKSFQEYTDAAACSHADPANPEGRGWKNFGELNDAFRIRF